MSAAEDVAKPSGNFFAPIGKELLAATAWRSGNTAKASHS